MSEWVRNEQPIIEQQISYTLEQAASETPRAEITRWMVLSEPICYRGK